jgi:hypothetical protein
VRLTAPHRKKFVTNNLHKPRTWTDYLDKRPKLRNMDMRFCTWNVRSLFRAISLMTVSKNQVEEDEMVGPCSTNRGEEERL